MRMDYQILYSECGWVCDFDLSRGFNKYAVYDVAYDCKRKVYFTDISDAYKYWHKCVENRNRIENWKGESKMENKIEVVFNDGNSEFYPDYNTAKVVVLKDYLIEWGKHMDDLCASMVAHDIHTWSEMDYITDYCYIR